MLNLCSSKARKREKGDATPSKYLLKGLHLKVVSVLTTLKIYLFACVCVWVHACGCIHVEAWRKYPVSFSILICLFISFKGVSPWACGLSLGLGFSLTSWMLTCPRGPPISPPHELKLQVCMEHLVCLCGCWVLKTAAFYSWLLGHLSSPRSPFFLKSPRPWFASWRISLLGSPCLLL